MIGEKKKEKSTVYVFLSVRLMKKKAMSFVTRILPYAFASVISLFVP